MILMHDRTYRKRLEEIKDLEKRVEFLSNDNARLESEKKDLIYQLEYYIRVNKVLRKKLEKYEK